MPNEFAISSEAMWVTYANEDGESVCEFEYCDEAIPTMYICHKCGAMVHTTYAEVHAVSHGWVKS